MKEIDLYSKVQERLKYFNNIENNEELKKKIKLIKPNKSSLKLKDIKLNMSNNNHSGLNNLVSNSKINFLNKIGNNKFSFKLVKDDGNSFILNIKPYKDIDDSEDLLKNSGKIVKRDLSILRLNGSNKYISLPILNIDMKKENIDTFIRNNMNKTKELQKFLNSSNLDNDRLISIEVGEDIGRNISVSELSNKLFKKKKDVSYWKNLFFQIIHNIASIQKYRTKFRHNNYNPENLRVSIHQKSDNQNKINFGNNKYSLTDHGFNLVIDDFDYSNIGGYIGNKDIKTQLKNISNRSFDIHHFFNSLIKMHGISKFNSIKNKKGNKTNEVIKFLDYVIPKKYRKIKY